MTQSSAWPPPVLQGDIPHSIAAELQPGEQVLWIDKPSPAQAIRGQAVISLFTLLVFPVFMAITLVPTLLQHHTWRPGTTFSIGTLQVPTALLAPLIMAIVFPCITLFGVSKAYRKARGTLYAITNRRALMIVTAGTVQATSITKRGLGTVTRTERTNGSGDLALSGGSALHSVTFTGVPQVRIVESILKDAVAAWPDD